MSFASGHSQGSARPIPDAVKDLVGSIRPPQIFCLAQDYRLFYRRLVNRFCERTSGHDFGCFLDPEELFETFPIEGTPEGQSGTAGSAETRCRPTTLSRRPRRSPICHQCHRPGMSTITNPNTESQHQPHGHRNRPYDQPAEEPSAENNRLRQRSWSSSCASDDAPAHARGRSWRSIELWASSKWQQYDNRPTASITAKTRRTRQPIASPSQCRAARPSPRHDPRDDKESQRFRGTIRHGEQRRRHAPGETPGPAERESATPDGGGWP